MKKAVGFLVLTLMLISCKQTIASKDIAKINGYWEIEKVELPDGEDKDYKVNPTIDYFELKGNKGFRQKVMPQFDGTYLTNNLKETIEITQESGDFYINYTTQYGKWKEEIIEIKDSVLVLKNKENLEYHYKKSVPFSVK
ncbi:MAG: hypothetical protein JNJ52_09140 [Flavobacterium sp.]|nr:hypothetical protein [Flavobacterium sp.]